MGLMKLTAWLLTLAWVAVVVAGIVCGVSLAHAEEIRGIATYYTEASCKREGTSGVLTASGMPYIETAFTAAMPTRAFGTTWRVCTSDTQRCVNVVQTDYGPGRKARARGVVIDLTPAAYDALGGKRGCKAWGCYGEIAEVTVTRLPDAP